MAFRYFKLSSNTFQGVWKCSWLRKSIHAIPSCLAVLFAFAINGDTRYSSLNIGNNIISTIQLSSIRLITPYSYGSGVVVDRKEDTYTALTAWHVVNGISKEEEVIIRLADGSEVIVNASNIERVLDYDLATITFKAKKRINIASLSNSRIATSGLSIYAAGWPLDKQELVINKGELVANADMGIPNGYQLLYTASTSTGMSGGGLYSYEGKLVGIHGRGEVDQIKSHQRRSIVKTGVNQGIPIRKFLNYRLGVYETLRTQPSTYDDYIFLAEQSASEPGREQTLLRLSELALAKKKSAKAYFYLAYAKSDLGLNEESIKAWSKSIEMNPDQKDAYLFRGYSKYDNDDLNGALSDYEAALRIDPSDFSIFSSIAEVKLMQSKYQEAITAASKSIDLMTLQNSDSFSTRGASYCVLGDFTRGIADLQFSISESPTDWLHHWRLGLCYRDQEQYDKAITAFNKVLEIGTNLEFGYEGRAYARWKSGKLNDAISDYNKLAHFSENKALAFENLGWIYNEQQQWPQAINSFKKSLEYQPDSYDVNNGLAWAYSQTSNPIESTKNYTDLIELSRNSGNESEAYIRRGISYKESGQYQLALKDFQLALDHDINNSRAIYWMGLVEQERKNYGQSILLFDRALLIDPSDHHVVSSRAYSSEMLENNDQAIEGYSRALKLSPQPILYNYTALSRIYSKKQDYKQAIAVLSEAITNFPDDYDCYLLRSSYYQSLSQPEKALDDYQAMTRIRPHETSAYTQMMHILSALNRDKDALQAISVGINLNPESEDLYMSRALKYWANESYWKAINDYSKVIQLNPLNKNAISSRAELYRGRGLRRQHHTDLNRLIEINWSILSEKDTDIPVMVEQASLLIQVKDFIQAKQLLVNIINMQPTHALAHFKLGQVFEKDGELSAACKQWTIAADYGNQNASRRFAKKCNSISLK